MARKKRMSLSMDRDTLVNLLNECYGETNTTRSLALKSLGKHSDFIEEKTDLAAFAKTQNDLIKILSETSKTKMELAKMIHNVVEADSKVASTTSGTDAISEMMKAFGAGE